MPGPSVHQACALRKERRSPSWFKVALLPPSYRPTPGFLGYNGEAFCSPLNLGLPMKVTGFLRAAGLSGLGLIIIVSLVPGHFRPQTGAGGSVEHFAAYGAVALLLSSGWHHYRGMVAICLIAMAALLEILQFWVPGRSTAVATAVASKLGVMVGVVGAAYLGSGRRSGV